MGDEDFDNYSGELSDSIEMQDFANRALSASEQIINNAANSGEEAENTLKKLQQERQNISDAAKPKIEEILKLEGTLNDAVNDITQNDNKPKTTDGKRVQTTYQSIFDTAIKEAGKGWDWLSAKFEPRMAKFLLFLFVLSSTLGTGFLIQDYKSYQLSKCFMVKSCVGNSKSGSYMDLPCDMSSCSCNTIEECQSSLPMCTEDPGENTGCPHYYWMNYTLDSMLTQAPLIPKAIWAANNDTGETSTKEWAIRISIFLIIVIGSIVCAVAFYRWYLKTFNPPD